MPGEIKSFWKLFCNKRLLPTFCLLIAFIDISFKVILVHTVFLGMKSHFNNEYINAFTLFSWVKLWFFFFLFTETFKTDTHHHIWTLGAHVVSCQKSTAFKNRFSSEAEDRNRPRLFKHSTVGCCFIQPFQSFLYGRGFSWRLHGEKYGESESKTLTKGDDEKYSNYFMWQGTKKKTKSHGDLRHECQAIRNTGESYRFSENKGQERDWKMLT